MKSLAIVNIGQLVTLEGPSGPRLGAAMRELGVLGGRSVLVQDGRISQIVSQSERLEADVVIDAQGQVVTPGLVDAHTHICFAGSRLDEWPRRVAGESYEQIAAAGGGILSTVKATRAADERSLSEQTAGHLRWLVRNGTTSLEAKTGYGLNFDAEQKMLNAIKFAADTVGVTCKRTYLGPHALPAGMKEEKYLDECIWNATSLKAQCDFADMFVEHSYFSPVSCRRYAHAVKSLGLPLRLHVDQLKDGGGALLAAEVGAVSADHLEYTSSAGFSALAKAKVMAGLLPGSVFGLRKSKYADGRGLIDAGVGIYVATDFNPGSSPVASLPFCMRLAVDYMGLTVEEAFCAVTFNAAWSLGLGAEVGSVEVGKRGDLCLWPVKDFREVAYFNGIVPTAVVAGGKRLV